ncbi:MAG: hypothetical protein GX221_04740 [Candidatus Riflebacteria bacterium]|nr:hypothetical protein [Candidatus Riflebacteria bacterium]
MKTKFRAATEKFLLLIALLVSFVFMLSVLKAGRTDWQLSRLEKERSIEILKSKTAMADLAIADRKRTAAQALEESQKRSRKLSELFVNLLDKKENANLFIKDLREKAELLNLVISGSSYVQPFRGEGSASRYFKSLFSFNVSGSYSDLKRFLWEVENNMGRAVKTNKILMPETISDKDGLAKAFVELEIYFSQ